MNDPNERDDLKRSAPTLYGLPKADPFVVPEGFFDRFPHEVQGLVTGKQHRASTWSIWKRVVVALPMVAVLGLGLWWATHPVADPIPVTALHAAPLTDGELDELSDDELVAMAEDIAPPGDDAGSLGQVALDLDDDELLAYLESNGADINELITTE